MADLKRRIIAEFSAKNKAKGEMAGFRRDMDNTGRVMKRMAAGALALAGIGGFGYLIKGMIKAASSAEETQAKFNTVFKDLSEQANIWAESFGQSVGRAERDVKSWMAGLQDTFVPLGIARNEALKLAQSLVTLAVDVASFNNAADADVIRDFTSALVGNHETVRKFGIIISETALKQEAMRQGIDKTYKNLTDLEKVQLRYNLILSGTSDAQGDAMRTSDSYANQVKRLTANWDDMKVMLGNEILPALADLVKIINENREAVEKFGRALAAPIESLKILVDLYKISQEMPGFGTGRAPPFGGGVPGLGGVPGTPPTIPKLSPRERQHMLEMKAATREQEESTRKRAEDRAGIHSMQMFEEQRKIIADINAQLQFEHELMEGTVAGPMADAIAGWEEMTRAEQAYAREFERTMEREEEAWQEVARKREEEAEARERAEKEAMDRMADKVREYNWTFTNIIASGLESTMRDYENWKEHLLNIFEELYWAALRLAFIEPAAQAAAGWMQKGFSWLAGGIAGGFGGGGAGAAAGIGTSPHGGSSAPALQYGGIVERTGLAFVHKGETFSGVGERTTNIVIHNETGVPMEISAAQEYLLSDKRIINVTMQAMQTDVRYRRNIAQVR